MTPNDFLTQIKSKVQISFAETIAVITEYYHYQTSAFRNGSIENGAGQNEGSCKIFTFARLHDLNEAQTLALFGDYYRHDVLNNPEGIDHQNIRQFIQHGWNGIVFERDALKLK